MLSTWKLLTISTLLISSELLANSNYDDKILKFEEKRFEANKRVDLQEVKVFDKRELSNDWVGYILDLRANVDGKEINAKDIVFTNGEYVAPELIDITNGKSLKSKMAPKLPTSYYNKEHLLYGSENAKDKIVVFSDPLCPFCIDFVPEVIKGVKKTKNVALYYYHFPLSRIHPAADVVVRAMAVADEQGIKDVVEKIYNADFEKYFDVKETNKEKILKGVNAVLNTKITVSQIDNAKINSHINDDIKMGENAMVQGTPTIYVNGDKDEDRTQWENIVK